MNKKNILGLMIIVPLVFLFSFIKINLISGSHRMFFSGIGLIFPVVGAFFGTAFSGIALFLFFIFKKMTIGGAITLGLPTFIATLSFSIMLKSDNNNSFKLNIYNFLLRVILPFFCMILFILHPVGKDAYLYSFYWLIPVGLYFFNKIYSNNSMFLKSLTSTFLAHAVGSLMWLYFVPTVSVYWISLIPIVFVERLIFATGISFLYLFIKNFFYKFIYTKNNKGIMNGVY